MAEIVQPTPEATAATAEVLRYAGSRRLTAMRRHDLARFLQGKGIPVATDATKDTLLVLAAVAEAGTAIQSKGEKQ